jgi:hypothetical protein
MTRGPQLTDIRGTTTVLATAIASMLNATTMAQIATVVLQSVL